MNKENNIIGLDLKIDQEYIGKVTSEVVKSGVVEALGGANRMVELIIANILNQKVDDSGKPTTSSYNKDSILDYHIRECIKEITKEEIIKIVEENKESLRKVI